MTRDEVAALIGSVLHEFQYDHGNPATEAVLAALAAAGLVIGTYLAEDEEVLLHDGDDGADLAALGLALVRVVAE